MSFQPALPPWLTKAVEDAGDATVILKPGDRPFVIKSKAPYHLGTQPMTNLTMEGLAQQILSEDAQQALSKGDNVEETLTGDQLSVNVNAVRLDHDIVIKLRNAVTKEPEVDEVAQQIEEETRIIKAETAQALRDAAAKAHQASLSPSAEVSAAAPRSAFVVQNAGGEPVADIELPVEEDAVDTFIAKLSPAAASTANAAVETVFDESASQSAGRTSAFARLSKFFSSSAAASEREEAARREQEEEAARRAKEDAARSEQEEAAQRAREEAARREQEDAARREQEEAARRDLEESARRAQDEAEAARRELAEVARRAQEEAGRREQEEATRRALEETARREHEEAARRAREEVARRAQDEAEAARRELAEATRRAQEDAARFALEEVARREQEATDRRAQEEAARREHDEAARRDLEERARRAHDEARAARRELAEVTRRAQEDAARRDHEEAARRQQEEAARLALKDAARQRLQTAEEGDIPAETEPTPARATVVGLNRRGPLAAATTELTDWILDAMDQGATALYLRAGKAPFARIDGQVEILAVEPIPLSMFERAGAMMSAGEDGWQPAGEWAWSKHIPGTGSVHCQAFSDGQGGGFIVQLPVSVTGLDEQVPRHIRNACETGEGLIVVSAPFAEDVAAMVGAVVAWSAHRRAGHIVSFGTNGSLERVAGNAFISDRPLPAGDHGMTTAVHAALRERPDMLVVIASGPLPAVHALVSAAVGRLVIVGVVARTAPRALEVLLNDLGPDRHLLAATFKAGCSWRGFRTAVERRLVIADTLVATDRVSALIEAGDITGLHLAQTQRTDGMRSVDAALAAAVARKKITLREAAACAVDRKSLISLVRRQAHQRRAAERDEQSAQQRASVLRTMNGA